MNKHVLLVTLLAGCPDSQTTLWLQPTNGEQNVKLGTAEPNPY
jgi:hypothetical protein